MLDKLAKEYFDYALRGGYAKVETPAKYIFYDNGGVRENVSKKIFQLFGYILNLKLHKLIQQC